jgi:hypothetical protein
MKDNLVTLGDQRFCCQLPKTICRAGDKYSCHLPNTGNFCFIKTPAP